MHEQCWSLLWNAVDHTWTVLIIDHIVTPNPNGNIWSGLTGALHITMLFFWSKKAWFSWAQDHMFMFPLQIPLFTTIGFNHCFTIGLQNWKTVVKPSLPVINPTKSHGDVMKFSNTIDIPSSWAKKIITIPSPWKIDHSSNSRYDALREAILCQIGWFFTHCVKGGGSNPCVKIYVANL